MSQKSASISDFSLLLTGLPYGEEYNQMDLRNKILEMFKDMGYKLKLINFVYDTDEYRSLQD